MKEQNREDMPKYIKEIELLLSSHTVLIDVKKSLHLFFNKTEYGCVKDYPVAIVHDAKRIKEAEILNNFKSNYLLDDKGLSYKEYGNDDLDYIIRYAPQYIQTVGFMLSTTKEMPHPTFFNKFKGDYWKKLQSIEGLEAIIDISLLKTDTSVCEAENILRGIMRKRKEVHQLKQLGFVWIAEVDGENPNITKILQHYFKDKVLRVNNGNKTYYLGWSIPLEKVNMRYFVCTPK